MRNVDRLCLSHFWVAFGAFLFACLIGTWQMWVRSPLGATVGTPGQYFMSVTAHGVSMAYVLTTFFIMGFGYFVAVTTLNRPLPGRPWAWAAFWIGLIGVVVTLIPIGLGKASVLFTFYPPLTGSVWFYLGLVMVVAASWIWCVLMLLAMVGGFAGRADAQTPTATQGTTRTLTLEEALKIAAEKNRDIEKAREYRNWVEGKYREELAVALPRATLNLNMMRSYDASQQGLFRTFAPADGDTAIGDIFGGRQDIRTGGVQFDQLIFSWGAVGAALKAAKMGFEFSDAQLARYQQSVARDVTAAFWDVLIAREFERIAQEAIDQRQRHLDETKKRQAAGTVTDFDVLAAEVGLQNVRPTLIRSANDVRVARDRLALLLAETGDIDVAGTLDTAPGQIPGYDEVLAKALDTRPELSELRTQIGRRHPGGKVAHVVRVAGLGPEPEVDLRRFAAEDLGPLPAALPVGLVDEDRSHQPSAWVTMA